MRMKPNQVQWVCSQLPCKVNTLVPLSFPICPWQTRIQWALPHSWSFPAGNQFPLGFTRCWTRGQKLLIPVFFPGLDHYYCYWCWASRGKHVSGPHTKRFG